MAISEAKIRHARNIDVKELATRRTLEAKGVRAALSKAEDTGQNSQEKRKRREKG